MSPHFPIKPALFGYTLTSFVLLPLLPLLFWHGEADCVRYAATCAAEQGLKIQRLSRARRLCRSRSPAAADVCHVKLCTRAIQSRVRSCHARRPLGRRAARVVCNTERAAKSELHLRASEQGARSRRPGVLPLAATASAGVTVTHKKLANGCQTTLKNRFNHLVIGLQRPAKGRLFFPEHAKQRLVFLDNFDDPFVDLTRECRAQDVTLHTTSVSGSAEPTQSGTQQATALTRRAEVYNTAVSLLKYSHERRIAHLALNRTLLRLCCGCAKHMWIRCAIPMQLITPQRHICED